jgi:signal transduction histidine kinase
VPVSVRTRAPVLALGALGLGAAALATAVPVVLRQGTAAKELPWIGATAVFLAVAAFTLRRLPAHPVARWFAVAAGLVVVVQLLDGVVKGLTPTATDATLAWVLLVYHLATVVGMAAIAHLIGLFPDGRVHRRYERRVLRALWFLLPLPAVVLLTRPQHVLPGYHMAGEVPNPYAIAVLEPVGALAGFALSLAQGIFALGVVLLVLRYRRAGEDDRRRIRWLLVPGVLAAAVAVFDLVAWRRAPGGPASPLVEVLLTALWLSVVASLPLAIAVALLRPRLLDVDRVLRKSLVYGLLWAVIAAAYVGAAAALGLAAGQRLPLEVAIGLAVVATLLFQPARRRLEVLADRWVFGARTAPTELITALGAALSETVELEQLLPRMADTLKEGLGLRWARVRLASVEPVDAEEPVLAVPIVLDGEHLGVVECGPRATGPLTDDDAAVVATLARQAALAVRNVRLTAELEASRLRLVRAQDAERRRIERNIHDGVQQDLVALIGHAGYVRSELRRDPAAGEQALADLQGGLQRVIAELRELAHGIHPSVLSDRGLLEAVEALAARSRLPVSVRADAALRGVRFAEEVEGAGYFTVAEALANIGKHAAATHAEVRLARADGCLRITVTDDGTGFAPEGTEGQGLVNLAERLAALGGRLDVRSRPGAGTTVSAQLAVTG